MTSYFNSSTYFKNVKILKGVRQQLNVKDVASAHVSCIGTLEFGFVKVIYNTEFMTQVQKQNYDYFISTMANMIMKYL